MSDFSGNRTVCIKCRVTQEEYAYIMQKLQCSGCSTMSDYLRKMAITGMIIRYDSALLKDLQQSLQRIGNNVNQIAIRVKVEFCTRRILWNCKKGMRKYGGH